MSLSEVCRTVAAGITGASVRNDVEIWFRRSGLEGRVEFPGENPARSGGTDFVVKTFGLGIDLLEVRTAGILHDLANLFGFRDLQVGDPVFDDRFHLSASDEGKARAILTPPVRSILRQMSIYGDFHWRLSRAGFLLHLSGAPVTPRELNAWLRTVFELLDALPGPWTTDPLGLERAEVRVNAGAICQVCGTTLSRGALVRCVKCATPHHRDCWEFNGRCSIFACAETRCV